LGGVVLQFCAGLGGDVLVPGEGPVGLRIEVEAVEILLARQPVEDHDPFGSSRGRGLPFEGIARLGRKLELETINGLGLRHPGADEAEDD
jgi:hypothetical protein